MTIANSQPFLFSPPHNLSSETLSLSPSEFRIPIVNKLFFQPLPKSRGSFSTFTNYPKLQRATNKLWEMNIKEETCTRLLLIIPVYVVLVFSLFDVHGVLSSGDEKECIRSKIRTSCNEDKDCVEFGEDHLYCNKTGGANLCAFQIETYAGQALADMDCPGPQFSAETWSNPISESVLDSASGVDCMRWCYSTATCFGITILDYKCFLRNDLCFANLQRVDGAILGVMATVREDYHCGCHYPFTRQRSNGQILSWTPSCPESQLDRNPYRCCSEKGLCVKCRDGESPPLPPTKANLSDLIAIETNPRNNE